VGREGAQAAGDSAGDAARVQLGAATRLHAGLAHQPLQALDRLLDPGILLLQLLPRSRGVADPLGCRGRQDRPQPGEDAQQQQDGHQRPDPARDPQPLAKAHDGLQQQLQHQREHDGQDDLTRHIHDRQAREDEQPAQEDGLRVMRQRHVTGFVRRLTPMGVRCR